MEKASAETLDLKCEQKVGGQCGSTAQRVGPGWRGQPQPGQAGSCELL
jgi:hypothetical protein